MLVQRFQRKDRIMAFCKFCGGRVDDGVKFCGSCGGEVEQVTSNTTSAFNNTNTQNNAQQQTTPPPSSEAADIEQNKIICAISYISILFFLPLLACPESRFGKFHANQSLILLIASSVIGVVGSIAAGLIEALFFLPDSLRTLAGGLVGLVVSAAPVAGMIFGIVTAIQGQMKEIPVIGRFNLINK